MVGDGIDVTIDLYDGRFHSCISVELQSIGNSISDDAAAGGSNFTAAVADPALEGQGVGDVQGCRGRDADVIGRCTGEVVAVGDNTGSGVGSALGVLEVKQGRVGGFAKVGFGGTLSRAGDDDDHVIAAGPAAAIHHFLYDRSKVGGLVLLIQGGPGWDVAPG